MGILDKLFGAIGSSSRYQTKAQFETNLARQISMTRQVLAQHKEYEDRELRLEFFFYTNTSENAEALNLNLGD